MTVREKLSSLAHRRQIVLLRLVEPARAAANAMKDAGMSHSADRLLELLFELDAIDAEMQEFVGGNLAAVIEDITRPES